MTQPIRKRLRLVLETLEERDCPSVAMLIDYSFDTINFFNSQLRRDLLQQAADSVAAHFNDTLLAITAGNGNTWTARFDHPATGALHTIPNLVVPANTIILFAGGRLDLGGALGSGGPGGFEASGSNAFLDLVSARGQPGALGPANAQTDLGPWGGSVTFDADADWHFGRTTDGLDFDEHDFLSVAIHEITHLLGFGTSSSWFNRIQGSTFAGPLATDAFDGAGSPPLNDAAHWQNGLSDNGQEAVMDPSLLDGTRKLATGLDRAALGDIGWQLVTDTDGTLNTATVTGVGDTGATFTSSGRSLENAIDVDFYRFVASAGQQVNITTTLPGGGINVNTLIRLFDANGAEIARADDGGTPAGYSQLLTTLPSTGAYFVGVSSHQNTVYLPTEAFARSLAGPTGDYNVTISQMPEVRFVSTGQSVDENAGNVQLAVQLSFMSVQDVSVPFTVTGSAAGQDFSLSGSPLLIPAGQTSATITITIVNDALDELDETVQVTLGTPTNALLGAAVHTVTIVDNDPPPSVQFTTASVSANEGAGIISLSVQLSATSSKTVTVPFSVSGTASGQDFTAAASPVTILAGQLSGIIDISLINDFLDEPDETVVVNLGAPTNASLGTAAAETLTILDNDAEPAVRFAASQLATSEGGAVLSITVELSAVSARTITVPFVIGGTATAGSDFTVSQGPLVLQPGQTSATIALVPLNDGIVEAAETVLLTLGAPTNASPGTPSQLTVTIQNSDLPLAGVLQFETGNLQFSEAAGTLQIPVRRTGGSAGAVSVQFALTVSESLRLKEKATLNLDLQSAIGGSVAFASNETEKNISLVVANDLLVEADLEFFTVTLQSPTGGAALGALTSITVAIVDDDLPVITDFQPTSQRLQMAANGFGKSEEHYRDFVTKAYARFLDRLPDEQGLTFWVTLMQRYETSNHQAGLRQEQIEAGFIDSPEYKGRHGGVGEAWVRAIYSDLLGREGEDAGVTFWLGQLNAGVTPTQVALGFTTSEERLRNRVADTYRQLLDREPDNFGLEFWVSVFRFGGTTEDIVSGFVGSEEYYLKPNRGGGNPVRWIKETYLDVLFRPPAVEELTFWINFLRFTS